MRNFFHKPIYGLVLFPLLSIFFLVTVGSAQQNLSTFTCNPVQVSTYKTYTVGTTTYTGRVWVLCNPPLSSTQQYFAVSLIDAAESARFLSLFTAAFVAGKALDIGYIQGDLSGQAYNCTATTSCYPAVSATIR
jgi:hypothetical protein